MERVEYNQTTSLQTSSGNLFQFSRSTKISPVQQQVMCLPRKLDIFQAETSSESNADEKPTPVENAEQKAPVAHRYDIVLWMFGILFIVLIHSMIFGCGKDRLHS